MLDMTEDADVMRGRLVGQDDQAYEHFTHVVLTAVVSAGELCRGLCLLMNMAM